MVLLTDIAVPGDTRVYKRRSRKRQTILDMTSIKKLWMSDNNSLTLPPQLEDVLRLLTLYADFSHFLADTFLPIATETLGPMNKSVYLFYHDLWHKNRWHLWWQPRNIFHFPASVSHHPALQCGSRSGDIRTARRVRPLAIPHLFFVFVF